jgi:hypothetical protein
MRRAALLLAPLLALALPCPWTLAADPPATIHYQGVLRSAAGAPLDGACDVVFRFFDAASGGGEILVDAHAAAGTGAVVVDGGLFGVALGGGAVSDGSARGVYLSLAELFRDFGQVFLQIEVGGEVLQPRVQVLAAAYAQNAATLGGRAAGAFVDASAAAQVKDGPLTVGSLEARGAETRLNADGPDGDTSLFFFENGSPTGRSLRWKDAENEFALNDSLLVGGFLRVGGTSTVNDNYLGEFGGPDSGDMDGPGDL